MESSENLIPKEQLLFEQVASVITESKTQLVQNSNSILTLLFWKIGCLINADVLQNKRAKYGKEIVATLSRQLVANYGRNFEEKNLRRMLQFAEEFQDRENVVTLSRHLSWSHFLLLIPLKSKEAQQYYAQQCFQQILGVRGLKKAISLKGFERSAIANLQLPTNTNVLFNTFKDPYFLDFLNLDSSFLEEDLEQAILSELEKFILELGNGFAFMERQKRLIIDGDDFYLDLLFYNRNLKRLVAIELKIGKFEASHKGQMELYLKWLDKHERQEGENTPIGLILCAESNKEQIELLEMHKDGIMVAEYWTAMPPKKEMEQKLHQLLIEAKERLLRQQIRLK